jgi:hypothetical protein
MIELNKDPVISESFNVLLTNERHELDELEDLEELGIRIVEVRTEELIE